MDSQIIYGAAIGWGLLGITGQFTAGLNCKKLCGAIGAGKAMVDLVLGSI
jgi:hypothetical protein